MTDHDDAEAGHSADDVGRIEEPRSEGVRIIGAQEAAEASGRSTVRRRRREGEKRYGDRPDSPAHAEDLPTVRISTSDVSVDSEADDLGPPLVHPLADEPRWADDEDRGSGHGHARTLPRETADSGGTDRAAMAGEGDEHEQADRRDGDRDEDAEPSDPFSTTDDSFVLPHWTEPPTGQVPKVVVGEDVFEEEPTASYAAAPRWRDEGERDVDTDFDDLLDDGPRLGALGGGDPFDDDSLDDGGFDAASERDPIEAFAPDEDLVIDERPSRRRSPRSGGGPDDGATRGAGGSGGDRNLPIAVGVGVALVAIGLVCFALGGLATTLLACVIVGVAASEFFGAVGSRSFQPAGLLGLVATVGLLLATYTSGLNAYSVVLPLTVGLGLIWYLWIQPGEHAVRNLGVTLFGVMWIGFLGSFATLMLGLGKVNQDLTGAKSNIGLGVVIAAVIVAVSHDVGAYFIGRYMGKTPLSSASPNKTLEGTVGGVGVAVLVTLIVVGIVGIAPIGGDIFRVFVFALLCAIVAPLGDLCESFVKRDLGIKDMGSLLPGHGGVLDRFDALLFVLPTAYFVTLLFGTWTGS